jgi:tetratricopeptide (TPR) repeat protein
MESSALSARKRVLGPKHRETIESMDTLAVIYRDKGKLTDAETLEKQALEIATKILGPEHETTRHAQRNLGLTYRKRGELGLAHKALGELLELTEQVRGSAPDFNASCAVGLGETLIAQGQYADAEAVLRRTLNSQLKTMPMAWQTAKTRSLLGEAIMRLQRFKEAEPLVVDGYREMSKTAGSMPPIEKAALKESGDRVIRLFTEWHMEAKVQEWAQTIGASETLSNR